MLKVSRIKSEISEYRVRIWDRYFVSSVGKYEDETKVQLCEGLGPEYTKLHEDK